MRLEALSERYQQDINELTKAKDAENDELRLQVQQLSLGRRVTEVAAENFTPAAASLHSLGHISEKLEQRKDHQSFASTAALVDETRQTESDETMISKAKVENENKYNCEDEDECPPAPLSSEDEDGEDEVLWLGGQSPAAPVGSSKRLGFASPGVHRQVAGDWGLPRKLTPRQLAPPAVLQRSHTADLEKPDSESSETVQPAISPNRRSWRVRDDGSASDTTAAGAHTEDNNNSKNNSEKVVNFSLHAASNDESCGNIASSHGQSSHSQPSAPPQQHSVSLQWTSAGPTSLATPADFATQEQADVNDPFVVSPGGINEDPFGNFALVEDEDPFGDNSLEISENPFADDPVQLQLQLHTKVGDIDSSEWELDREKLQELHASIEKY